MSGATSISFQEIAEIDLDALDGLGNEELLEHFRSIGRRATEGQLREVLEIGVDEGFVSFQGLVDEYAGRRHKTALRLRSLRGF